MTHRTLTIPRLASKAKKCYYPLGLFGSGLPRWQQGVVTEALATGRGRGQVGKGQGGVSVKFNNRDSGQMQARRSGRAGTVYYQENRRLEAVEAKRYNYPPVAARVPEGSRKLNGRQAKQLTAYSNR